MAGGGLCEVFSTDLVLASQRASQLSTVQLSEGKKLLNEIKSEIETEMIIMKILFWLFVVITLPIGCCFLCICQFCMYDKNCNDYGQYLQKKCSKSNKKHAERLKTLELGNFRVEKAASGGMIISLSKTENKQVEFGEVNI